jgi:hypothetical protein
MFYLHDLLSVLVMNTAEILVLGNNKLVLIIITIIIVIIISIIICYGCFVCCY